MPAYEKMSSRLSLNSLPPDIVVLSVDILSLSKDVEGTHFFHSRNAPAPLLLYRFIFRTRRLLLTTKTLLE